jgi:hypothetical protein
MHAVAWHACAGLMCLTLTPQAGFAGHTGYGLLHRIAEVTVVKTNMHNTTSNFILHSTLITIQFSPTTAPNARFKELLSLS